MSKNAGRTRRVRSVARLCGVAFTGLLLAVPVATAATGRTVYRPGQPSDAKPKLHPKVVTTPIPTPTPTPVPTPTPSAAQGYAHPSLLLDNGQIAEIRARIAAGTQPETGAFSVFMDNYVYRAMNATPTVYAGPYTGVEDWSHVFDTLNFDGGRARDLAIAYALTGDDKYAAKCRQFLVAWAVGNTPTTQQDADMNDIGYHQAYGAFSFAYAYDLTQTSAVYTDSDRAAVKAWFTKFIYAIGTANDKIAGDWCVQHPEAMAAYSWDATKHYRRYDTYVGGDAALLGQSARMAMAVAIDDTKTVGQILNGSGVLNLGNMLKSALTPVNDGDGVSGHPKTTPHVYVYADFSAGRGGMLDYMTYNTRACNVLVDMAQNVGWNATRLADAKQKLATTWSYLGRFFGPGAEPDFNPLDVINYGANVPRFALPLQDFGGQHFADILNSGDRNTYYEPQLLGPVTLTNSVAD